MSHRANLFAGVIRPLISLLLLFSSSGWSLPTQPFAVNAAIVNGCVISGTNTGVYGALNFGSLPAIGTYSANASLVQNATITLACTPGTTLNMSINGGSHFASSSRNLQRTGGTNLVAYSLYSNAGLTTAIPVNQNVTLSYSNANNIILPVYGHLQVTGVNTAGSYTDTLTVTLSW
ncbi:spore coat U domain-containing protein [Erwinia pyrifoliae]|uniref:Spore coat U domain-containing protein n=1 Tax=Erwinia pyrifoliae TaxID=79967 RepID=A0ABY5X702_ERWPY|nr:spore coat U domain-containing protein [Erwinia pyrifoliae]AUX71493.1 SCPU domain-containing protein [Erwinia pyrifoliae]MCA8878295.1 spore coat protein U domain-containing protein [Erwinia pyrifoliae]MCT2385966.1 spore coat U domain-containing protein [Erwinia pyrifoliae]MCU8588447.1 spore coat U domain-containing protein [Erwinia pyrifoliae]UWS29812.1 spore coat U domain-containing protein [Erwinia pyrifoliae]